MRKRDKKRQIFAAVIAIILVFMMVVPMLMSAMV